MKSTEFYDAYPALASAFGAFCDSPAHDDEQLAREMRSDLPADRRANLISQTLGDAHRFMPTIDQNWELLRKEVNRRLYTCDDARDWLIRITVAWQEELTRLQAGDSETSK